MEVMELREVTEAIAMGEGEGAKGGRRTLHHLYRPLFLLFAFLLLCAQTSCAGPDPEAPRTHVYIPRGASLASVADTLEAHGVIEGAWQWRLYARLRGLAKSVRPGLYEFALNERWSVIVNALRTGRTDDFMFTVPEGLTVVEIAELAAERLRLARDSVRSAIRDSFLAAARDPALRAEFGIVVPPNVTEPLEGYLLPETYRVAYDMTSRDVVRLMLRQFTSVWDSSLRAKAEALGFTMHEAVTLASIVEAEARVRSEQRKIAGVYVNRLRRRMLLQADPTVIYSLGTRVRRVLYRHLRERNPYNTYMFRGLPPGPINNPGRDAILAALEPEPHGFYFFVARPDGRHMFSQTPGQHADSVRVARVLRDSAERAQAESLRVRALEAP